MDDETIILFQDLGISLMLGMLVGLQRQRSNELIAGLRTFPLISVLGTLSAAIDVQVAAGGWVVAAGLLSIAAAALTSHALQFQAKLDADPGMTSIVSILLMYAVGAYLIQGDRSVAVAVGGGTAVLLQFKPELHGFAQRLGDTDLRAIMTFVLITCVVLPVLPNRTFDLPSPLNVLNPFEIWLMVVLIVGISLGVFLIYKFLGKQVGVLLVGILGGAISSTATTASFARRTRLSPASAGMAAVVVLIASTVVFVRVLIEVLVVAPTKFLELAAPISVPLLFGIGAIAFEWLRSARDKGEMPEQKNPTELPSAIVFGLLFACVLMALAAAKSYFGDRSMYVVALLSGLTDMDAITLSSAKLTRSAPEAGGISSDTAWRLILTAAMANLVFKTMLAVSLGHRDLRWKVARLLAIPCVASGLTLLLWPE